MKKAWIAIIFFFLMATFVAAQSKPRQKQPSQAEMNKLLEQAMREEGMSKEEQEEMKKMMTGMMPALMENNANTADYPEFTSNKALIPQKDATRISIANRKKITQADIKAYADNLFAKLMAKGNAAETGLAKNIIAKTVKAADMNQAALLAMLQGHPETSMALAIKAVQLSPANINYQNNMAALLTQYGYAEQAIPVLQKLNNDAPGNSTILNNLAHAWLSLGETDSAKIYANGAILMNAAHPEAMLCGGLMDELKGDPIKKYTAAMENAINPFTENLLNNSGQKNTSLDFNKIRRNIAIHEYFPINWIQPPPEFVNDVTAYNENIAWQKAYQQMIEKLRDNIEAMTKNLEKDLDKAVDKGEDEFVKEMAAETIKGLSMMSKPATSVLKVLAAYESQRQLLFSEELQKVLGWKEGLKKQKNDDIKKIYDKIDDRKGTTCKQFKTRLDEIENVYMRQVNDSLGRFLKRKAIEHHQWLNAWVTWNWYVAGNIKNSILMQDIQAAGYLAETYTQVVQQMEFFPEHCGGKTVEIIKTVPVPEIPNFSCPAVVSIPRGAEWDQLTNASKNFDANKLGIKKTTTPVPNVTVAYGIGTMIAQPGPAPFIKTANGSITPGTGNDGLEELAPIPKIPLEELAPLPRLPKEDELAPLPDLRKSKIARELVNKMMTASCDGKKTKKKIKFVVRPDFSQLKIEEVPEFKVGMGELVLDPVQEFTVGIGELIIDPLPASSGEFKVGMGKLEFIDTPAPKPAIKQIIQDVKAAISEGLQPTISSGVQAPNTFKPTKGLFQ